MMGTVHLVGAGPGDPGLVTLRCRELIEAADCLLYDYLVAERLLDWAQPTAKRIFVGKRCASCHLATLVDGTYVGRDCGKACSSSQERINDLLLECAREHDCVVRLKGGDPFVFGRGAEEAQILAAQGIPFSIVPGVTSGVAAPAYAGIPVTHRDHAASVVFITGHRRKDHREHDWQALARIDTLVCYMGVRRMPELCERLLAAGKDPSTPAAVVQSGTQAGQRQVVGTLTDLPERSRAAGIASPAIIVIGSVVDLQADLDWFQPPAQVRDELELGSRQ